MRLKVLLPTILILLAWNPVAGQVRIVGRVIDDYTEDPLGQVDITLLAPDGSVLARSETGDAGTFDFSVRRLPAVRIRATRFGYRGNTTPLLLRPASVLPGGSAAGSGCDSPGPTRGGGVVRAA